jgi:hypothetical protein
LGVQLLDNLSLTVKTLARLDALAGNIISASSGGKKDGVSSKKEIPHDTSPDTYAFRPRRVEGCTTSGQISGVWPLSDSLILKSTSGDIRIGIEPQPNWDSSSSEKAELAIRSTSGGVDFRTHGVTGKTPQVPNRDYVLDVHTTSGNVHGLAPLSSGATVKSTSGSLKLGLLPVLVSKEAGEDDSNSKPVEVSTSSTSGTTSVTIFDALYFSPSGSSTQPLRNIHNQHTSTSGDFHLYLPVSWEGEIVMNTLSGKLGVSGKDVKLIKNGEQWPGFNKEIVARKGDVGGDKGEGSRVKVSLTSGSGEVRVG